MADLDPTGEFIRKTMFAPGGTSMYEPITDAPCKVHEIRRCTICLPLLPSSDHYGHDCAHDPALKSRAAVATVVDMVNHPPHYSSHPSGVECIEITRHLTFDYGNAFKYVFRAEFKNGREDYDKARWYLDDAIRHADPVFLISWCYRHERLLHRVIQAETRPHRLRFFDATRCGSPLLALEAVQAILAAT